MRVEHTQLGGVFIIYPDVFEDERGFFMESWNAHRYREHGLDVTFVQDNISFSRYGVLRGLHFQNPSPQGKLITVLAGEIFDVAVDIRLGSPTFGQWEGITLSSENKHQFYVPSGFAHGFVVTSDEALVNYKCTRLYKRETDRALRWDDPDLGIDWPVDRPVLSEKDARAPFLRAIPEEHLFQIDTVATH